MNKKQLIKAIDKAHDRVLEYIKYKTSPNPIAQGLAYEGYDGGYAQALQDVILASNDVRPQTRGFWDGIDAFDNDSYKEQG